MTGPLPTGERRKNKLLRMLIDEMLQHIREMQQHSGDWPDEERARAEQDLERIMAQVRGAAFRKGAT
ncbi:MAG: hypothetical protein ACT4R6_02225 [Gemmatimonadaceae bacterium]